MSEVFTPTFPEQQLLISSTTSQRRIEALKQMEKNGVEIHSHPGPVVEPDWEDTSLVAKAKSDYVKEMIDGAVEQSQKMGLIEVLAPTLVGLIVAIARHDEAFKVIAADSRTETYEMTKNTGNRFVSHGKPKDAQEVQRTADRMSKTEQAIYQVFSGSYLADYKRGTPYPVETRAGQLIKVRLKPEMVKNLTSDEGMRRYLQAFNEFYSSGIYKGNRMTNEVEITDLSGGFSLPVFFKEGMIEKLSLDGGQEVTPGEASDELLRQVIFGVGVGYAPSVLDRVMPGAYDFIIDNWQWLRDVVADIRKGKNHD